MDPTALAQAAPRAQTAVEGMAGGLNEITSRLQSLTLRVERISSAIWGNAPPVGAAVKTSVLPDNVYSAINDLRSSLTDLENTVTNLETSPH